MLLPDLVTKLETLLVGKACQSTQHPLPRDKFIEPLLSYEYFNKELSSVPRKALSLLELEAENKKPTMVWETSVDDQVIVVASPAKDDEAPYWRIQNSFLERDAVFSNTVCAWSLSDCLSALCCKKPSASHDGFEDVASQVDRLDPKKIYLIPYGLCRPRKITRIKRAHVVLLVIVNNQLYLLNSQPAFQDLGYTDILPKISAQFGLTYQPDTFLQNIQRLFSFCSITSHWINYGDQSFNSELCPWYVLKLIQLFLKGRLTQEDFVERGQLLEKLLDGVMSQENVSLFKDEWCDGSKEEFAHTVDHRNAAVQQCHS